MSDPEIDAMATLKDALEPLEADAVDRVLQWAANRFSVDLETSSQSGPEMAQETVEEPSMTFERLADLYHKASPSTQQERVLTAAYWFQVVKGEDELTARAINRELKHLGRKVSNITRAFGRLEDKDPSLAMQVRKTGNSRQAPKIYRLTEAGIRYVEEMLESAGES